MIFTDLIKRLIYLGYYVCEPGKRRLMKYLDYAGSHTGKSKLVLISDNLSSVLKYNISIKDYFSFRFFELDHEERSRWAGTGYMYEYQLVMNPRGARRLLEDKILFLDKYRKFVKREFADLGQIEKDLKVAEKLLANNSGRLVLKGSMGQVGAEVEVIDCRKYTPLGLVSYMRKAKYNLAEEYVIQHSFLMKLSPSGLNTVRVFTQLYNGKIEFLGARLRITINSSVDNMAAGNLAAEVDMRTGQVVGPGVYSDITKEPQLIHPVTGMVIKGFVVPHWEKVVALAGDAAMHFTENKSVGWDIAIREDGPELIEGNHNWCKLLWQLPVRAGLKEHLDKYL